MPSKIQIRPVSKDDVLEFLGKPFDQSLRGVAVELDGKVIGIGAVLHTTQKQAFSNISEELRRRPVTLCKAAKIFRGILNRYDSRIVAYPSPEEHNSKGFLKWVGFEPTDESEEVFLWKRS